MKFRFFHAALATFLIIAIAGAPHLYAQPPSQSTPSVANIPRTITLGDAIRLAIERNYAVRTSGNVAERNDIAVTKAKDNMWLPTAGASGSWGYQYSLEPLSDRTRTLLQINQGSVVTTVGDTLLVNGVGPGTATTSIITPAGSQSLSWNASANENLFNGFSDIASVHEAEASLASAQNNFTWTRQLTAFNVTHDYLDVLRTGELVTAADSTLAEGQAQLTLIRGQYEAGVVPILQMYQQQSVMAGDSLALIQAINAYQNAQATILFDLNIPPSDYNNYNFTVTGIDTSTAPAVLAAVDTTLTDAQLNAAIDKRPDIIAQERNIDARKYGIDVTRGSLLPSLNASAGIGGSGVGQDLLHIPVTNGLNVGLKLSVPIFDAMQVRLSIQEQEVDVENERITLEQDVQQLRNGATQAVNNLKAAELALHSTISALNAADESFRLAAERQRVGAGTEVDVIISEAAVETARGNWVNAKYNWVLAQRQLAYTLGQWNY